MLFQMSTPSKVQYSTLDIFALGTKCTVLKNDTDKTGNPD